jgi:type II secretion system protein J
MKSRSGFTLLELLIAAMIAGVVLAALNTAFFAAFRLRNNTTSAVERVVPTNHAVGILKSDLRGIIVTGGQMANIMQSPGASIANNQPSLLDVCTTTGTIDDELPWGDVQRISYYLKDPTDPARAPGKDLVRAITRNILATTQPDLTEQVLLHGVDTLQFSFFDGANWQDNWDSGSVGASTPVAVKIAIEFSVEENNIIRAPLPIELVVPITVQSGATNLAATGGAL